MSDWEVTIVHGRDSEDKEILSNLHAAMEWARLKGAEYHPGGVDCLGRMMEVFVKEDFSDVTTFQYGMNYHWVTFEKLTREGN
jgi:hypothetical protein